MHLENTNLPRLETLIQAYGAATMRASINDMQSKVRANNGIYYGLKVVFACLYISLSQSS